MNKPKDSVTINDTPDGEFICVMGYEERMPLPEIDMGPFMVGARMVKAKPYKKPIGPWRELWNGFKFSLGVSWYIGQVLIVMIAILVAASLIGAAFWYGFMLYTVMG